MTLVSNVYKIAILRANAVGDFLVTLPAIHALKAAYPEAEIVLLGKPWHKDFLINGRCPVDRVEVVPLMKGIREENEGETEEKGISQFLERLKTEKFDLAVNFQGRGIAANPFLNKINARVVVGCSGKEAEAIDRNLTYYYYQSEPIRYLEIVELVGAKPVMLEPEIRVFNSDKEEAWSVIKNSVSKPFIALHPTANDIRRMWGSERFSLLADKLTEKGFGVVFTGSDSEKKGVDEIISEMRYKAAINVCGRLSLGGLAALFTLSELVISVDSGPLHLARAVNAKTVGLYWAPNLINWGPLTRRNHFPLISWKMECPLCGVVPNDPFPFEPKDESCSHSVSFVSDISVEKVLSAVDKQLNE